MKNKSYIILGIAIAVLIGAFLLISSIDTEKPQEKENNTVTIYETENENIKTVSVKNSYGEYTFINGETPSVEEKTDIDIDTAKIESFIGEWSFVTSNEIINENPSDLSEYGLANPVAVLSITVNDGEGLVLYMGDNSPLGNGRYVKADKENKVYILSQYKSEMILRKLDYYRNTVLFNIDSANISEVSYEKKNEKAVTFKRITDSNQPKNEFTAYRMTYPYDWPAESVGVSKIIDSLINLEILEYVNDDMTNLNAYGLEPYMAKITIKEKDGKINELFLGMDTDGKVYVRCGYLKGVYKVASEGFSYLNNEPKAFLSNFAYIKNIDTVKKIVYNYEDKIKATYEISKNTEDYDVKKDGKYVSIGSFREIFAELISISTGGAISHTPDDKPILTYEFYFEDGSKDTVSYYRYDDRKISLSVNGKIQFYVGKAEFDARINKINKITEGL